MPIAHCHPQRGTIVDTQFELAFDVDALQSNLATELGHDAENGTTVPGDGTTSDYRRRQQSDAKGHDGETVSPSADLCLVPLVISSYDFNACSGNRSGKHSCLLPLKPVMFDVRVHTFDLSNTMPVATEKICKTFGISKSKHPQVIAFMMKMLK